MRTAEIISIGRIKKPRIERCDTPGSSTPAADVGACESRMVTLGVRASTMGCFLRAGARSAGTAALVAGCGSIAAFIGLGPGRTFARTDPSGSDRSGQLAGRFLEQAPCLVTELPTPLLVEAGL